MPKSSSASASICVNADTHVGRVETHLDARFIRNERVGKIADTADTSVRATNYFFTAGSGMTVTLLAVTVTSFLISPKIGEFTDNW